VGGPGYDIGYLHSNPAGLSVVQTPQLYIGSGTTYLDYAPLSAGVVVPFSQGVLGVYYATLRSSDAIHTSASADRPVSEGSILHQFNLASVSFGVPIGSQLSIGALMTWEDQVLYSTRGVGYSVDLGAMYRDSHWWVGLYTQHLVSTGYQWSTRVESFSKNVALDCGIYWDRLQLGTTVGLLSHRIYGKLPLHPMLALSADTEFDTTFALTNYRYGVLFDFPGAALQYTHLEAANVDLGLSQDLFGIVVSW
jgi:hypothetical protein